MNNHEPTYRVLDQAAFLIKHICIPKYIPSYHLEATRIFAETELRLFRQPQLGGNASVSE